MYLKRQEGYKSVVLPNITHNERTEVYIFTRHRCLTSLTHYINALVGLCDTQLILLVKLLTYRTTTSTLQA